MLWGCLISNKSIIKRTKLETSKSNTELDSIRLLENEIMTDTDSSDSYVQPENMQPEIEITLSALDNTIQNMISIDRTNNILNNEQLKKENKTRVVDPDF